MGNSTSVDFSQVVSALKNTPIDEVAGSTQTFSTLFPAEQRIPVMEVFATIQPTDIRYMRQSQPRNLALIVVEAVATLVEAASNPTVKNHNRALNAVRVLSRLLPILHEQPDNPDQFMERLFWTNQIPPSKPVRNITAQPTDTSQAVESTGVQEVKSTESSPSPQDRASSDWELRPGCTTFTILLGTQLVHATMRLLFSPSFTVDSMSFDAFAVKFATLNAPDAPGRKQVTATSIPPSADGTAASSTTAAAETAVESAEPLAEIPTESNAVWPMILWQEGVGFASISPGNTAEMYATRVDILRLIMAMCSGPLYSVPEPQKPARSRFLDELTSEECPFAPTLFYSLLNTVVMYDPVGWGVPYASTLFGDREEPLVNSCVQVLLALLDYAPLIRQEESATPDASEPQLFAQFNIYRSMLAGLSNPDDFMLIFKGITRLLSTIPTGDGAILPNSVPQVTCFQELLVLLWKMFDENPALQQHVLRRGDVSALVTPMMYLMWAGRQDITRVGLMHLCTFILLLVSGERDFALSLTKPFTARLPADLPLFEGSHADLLIITLHKLIVDGTPKLATLYSCFLTIIANISPYARKLSVLASSKLINLFELFTSPGFLFARQNNYTFALQLLETYNNILQYGYEGNSVFAYAVLRRKEVFEQFIELTVSSFKKASSPSEQRKVGSPKAAQVATAEGVAVDTENHPVDREAWLEQHSGPSAPGALSENAAIAVTSKPPVSAADWVATDEWFEEVKQQLPLSTIIRMLDYLQPLLEEFVEGKRGAADDEAIVDFLKTTTLVGVLPVPHPILIRRYTPNTWTSLWYTTFIFSTIFLHVSREIPLWDATAIRLFHITIT